ncbi:hypothetical protein KSP40_PGU012981 [Platanthera guangdongensis]|uniref:Uncharacterized protein n=1 Tax=Platanthera guangdongensis TaxID=2320717 RepID=A0ABR2MKG6_9ASPA
MVLVGRTPHPRMGHLARLGLSKWADVDSLIKELQMVGGVCNVTKGRFFFSPALAPAFQVYMASMFDNQYKLLARYENKVQEAMFGRANPIGALLDFCKSPIALRHRFLCKLLWPKNS